MGEMSRGTIPTIFGLGPDRVVMRNSPQSRHSSQESRRTFYCDQCHGNKQDRCDFCLNFQASWILNDRTESDVRPDRTMMVMVFGQLVDHDITLTPQRKTPDGDFLYCCFPDNRDAAECCPIVVDSMDPFYSAPSRQVLCLPFLRSRYCTLEGKM